MRYQKNTSKPIITGPSGGAGSSTSSKSTNENSTVHTFSASPGDSFENQTITWSLNGGADASKFNIDSNGALTFKSAPDLKNPLILELIILMK